MLAALFYDGNQHLSYLVIVDAEHNEQGPIATVHFDQALPLSFHGNWHSY